MGNHELKKPLIHTEKDTYRGACKCGASTGDQPSRQAVEDAHAVHLKLIDRVRTQLGSRTPSLKTQAEYYREMSEDPHCTESDRALFLQLATEVETRLGLNAPPYMDEELPFE